MKTPAKSEGFLCTVESPVISRWFFFFCFFWSNFINLKAKSLKSHLGGVKTLSVAEGDPPTTYYCHRCILKTVLKCDGQALTNRAHKRP